MNYIIEREFQVTGSLRHSVRVTFDLPILFEFEKPWGYKGETRAVVLSAETAQISNTYPLERGEWSTTVAVRGRVIRKDGTRGKEVTISDYEIGRRNTDLIARLNAIESDLIAKFGKTTRVTFAEVSS